MITDALRELQRQQPFVPFSIHLTAGRSITIRHPEMLMISPGGSTAVAYEGDEKARFIQLVQVTTLETINGQVVHDSKK